MTRPLALVTGVGRAEGIGAAVAVRLAQDGWDVAVTSWRSYDARLGLPDTDPALDAVRNLATAAGAQLVAVPADLEDPASPARLYDEVTALAGRAPQALVLSHCESVDSGLMATSIDSFDRHYAVNVRASWLLIRELARRLPPSASPARIVALTSDATVGNLPYGATKGALDRLVVAAASELAHLGITANVVNPGPTDTGWIPPGLAAEIVAATPAGRLGTPTDAANLIGFLLSHRGGWVNGQVICSDGGIRS